MTGLLETVVILLAYAVAAAFLVGTAALLVQFAMSALFSLL